MKTFLRWSYDNNFHKNDDFKKWDNISSDTYEIALSQDELEKMYEHDYTDCKRLEKVRDVFVFGCATGLRYSDYSKIDRSKVQDDHIVVNTQKGKNYVTIPLNKYSCAILLKYDYSLPMISPQRFRDYIKEVAENIGMTKLVSKVSFIGAERIEVKIPRYSLVSSHTARRTFITLSLEKGMRPEVIMSITNHSDYKSFQKYIKLSQRVKADEMKKAWS